MKSETGIIASQATTFREFAPATTQKRTKLFSSMKFTSPQFRYDILAPIIFGARFLDE